MKTSKLEKWLIIGSLVIFCAITFVQFEIEGVKDALGVVSDWMYSQMVVVEGSVTPNLGFREAKAHVDDIVASIYQLESSSGKNDKCERKGKGYNGYGWGQSLTNDNCYPDRKLVEAKVSKWVSQKLDEGYSDAELMCFYNLGKPNGVILKDCGYYQNSLALK